jgi:IS30 family transposase
MASWRQAVPAARLPNDRITTLVERHSRFTILSKLPSKDKATLVAALTG